MKLACSRIQRRSPVGGVAVVACRVESGQVVGGEGGELVGGECLRRGNVENVRSIIEVFRPGIRGSRAHWLAAGCAVDSVQGGHEVAQGLARGGTRRHDHVTAAAGALR